MTTQGELRVFLTGLRGRDVTGIHPDDDLRDVLDIDSLEQLDLLASVEGRFGVRFRDEQLAGLVTLQRIGAAIEEQRSCVSA